MNEFNEKEFRQLCEKFNTASCVQEVTIRYANSSFYNKMKKSIEADRRGEVTFCVIRPNGKVVAVTCEEYPQGIYRIPTGGINYGEDIVEAVYREVKEELGLEIEILEFAGVLKIRFEHENDSVMFYSYLFIVKEIGGRLLTDAGDDEVSDIIEADLEQLETITNALRSIEGKWSDWGRFRYESTNMILKHLRMKSHV